MKLHILSDLHLEFSTFEPFKTDADVVILAGDIAKGDVGIKWARSAFPHKEIIYVPGNHEFYQYERTGTLDTMRNTATAEGVHLLDNDEVIINGVRFLGSTLWTDFRLFGSDKKESAMIHGKHDLQDFRLIHEGVMLFTPARSIELHEESLAWLTAKLDSPFNGKTVVVTHHLPSEKSVVERYRQEWLAACFASELGHQFGKMALWVHGHTHDNLDYESAGTRVICNPRGYVTYQRQENFDFNPVLIVEV